MIKKALLIVVTFYAVSIFQSCCTQEYTYKWTGFNIQVIDNSGIKPVISENYRVGRKALGLRIVMSDSVSYIVQSFKMMNECYATSCGEHYTRLHHLNSISIKTLNNYSENYPQGSDITPLFRARYADAETEDYTSISALIASVNSDDDYSYMQLTPVFDLYLMDITCTGGEQQFEINFMLSDGKVLTKQTDVMILY